MNKRKKWTFLCLALLMAILILSWVNATLPGGISKAITDSAAEYVNQLVPGVDSLSGLQFRKIAHFLVYAILGALICGVLLMTGKRWWLALPLGCLAACVDEILQIPVPGREPAMRDVLIDAAGVAVGMILLKLGYNLWKRKQTQ